MPPLISPTTLRALHERVNTLDRDTSKLTVRKARSGGGGGSSGSTSDLHLATVLGGLPVLTTAEIGHRGYVTTGYKGPYVWDGEQWLLVPVFYFESQTQPIVPRDGDFYEEGGVVKVAMDSDLYHITHTRGIS